MDIIEDRNTYEDISYSEKLDTTMQLKDDDELEVSRIASILKLSSLFSKKLILSDSQFIDNRGIRILFNRDKNFRKFISKITLVGTRKGVNNFRELAESQLNYRMLFSSFPNDINDKIKSGKLGTFKKLCNLTYKIGFEKYIEKLDDIFSEKNKNIKVKYGNYANLVRESININKERILDKNAKKLAEELIPAAEEEIKKQGISEPTRTTFLNVIRKSKYDNDSQHFVKRFFLDKEYNKNFWCTNNFNRLSHTDEFDDCIYKNIIRRNKIKIESSKFKKVNLKITKLPPLQADKHLLLRELNFDFFIDCHDEISKSLNNLHKIDKRGLSELQLKENISESYCNHISKIISLIYQYNKRKANGFKKRSLLVGVTATLISGAFSTPYISEYLNIPIITPSLSVIVPISIGMCVILEFKNYFRGNEFINSQEKLSLAFTNDIKKILKGDDYYIE